MKILSTARDGVKLVWGSEADYFKGRWSLLYALGRWISIITWL